MNRKQLLNQIKEEIREKEQEIGRLSEEELAVFILWKLIERKSFDSQYFFGSKIMREKIYQAQQKEYDRKPKDEEETKRNLICVGMSAEYKYIAEELGLKVSLEKVSYSENGDSGYDIVKDLQQGDHIFNIVYCSNGQKIKIDAQKEIARMQTQSMPLDIDLNFNKEARALIPRSLKDEEEKRKKRNDDKLDQILRRLGYIEEDELYTNEYCKKIIEENKDSSEIEIVKKIIENPILQGRFNKSKISELYRTYNRLIKNVACFRKAVAIPCYIERTFGKRQYSLCIYSEDQEDCGIWIYSSNSQKMENINFETMRFFLEKGLSFITDITEDGYRIRKMIASMKNRIESKNEDTLILYGVDDILELD